MFFNNDLLIVVGSIIVGSVFTYTFYNNIFTINNSESLVNTFSNSDLSIKSNSLPIKYLIDASVQTNANIQVEASVQAATTYVNTGMQTSARMWLESIRNWITEILGTTPNPGYVDVGVQTNATTTWQTVKQWFLEVCSIRNSDSSLQQLVDPNDSASQVSEVISESSIQNVARVYDITDQEVLANFMEDPSVYSYFDITDNIHYIVSDTLLTVDPNIFNLFI
jgi:hypothetical protein